MSFNFEWPTFSRQFHADAAKMLDAALNRGPKPKVIADDIKVEDINMGTVPPELEILEIGELSSERLRGIFRLTYTGNAHLLLSTKVQANPLTRPESSGSMTPYEDVSSAFPSSTTSRGILFAARPLIVPMQLRLSSMRLKAIIVLVVSKQKGITLVFKNDPLESVEVSSTFDSVAVVQKYLQQEIEGQLREMFREDLPGIIHRLSQSWLSGKSRKSSTSSGTKPAALRGASEAVQLNPLVGSANAEQPSIPKPPSALSRKARSSVSVPVSNKGKSPSRKKRSDKAEVTPSSSPPMAQRSSSTTNTPRGPSRSDRPLFLASKSPSKAVSPLTSPSKRQAVSATNESAPAAAGGMSFSSSTGSIGGFGGGFVHDVQNYDPTYGLRPDEARISVSSGNNFSGLARLTGRANRGLGDLTALSDERAAGEKRQPAKPSAHIEADAPQPESPQQLTESDSDDVLEIRGNGRLGDLDDVPDDPSHEDDHARASALDTDSDGTSDDVDDVDDLDDVDEAEDDNDRTGNYSRYGYPPASAEFSTSSVEESTRHSASLFGSASAISTSPRQPGVSPRFQPGTRSRASSSSGKPAIARVEYEMVPAVGGGMVTRPRVYHIASRIQAPDVEEEDELATHQASSVAPSSTARGPSSSRTAQTVRPQRRHGGRRDFDNDGDSDSDNSGNVYEAGQPHHVDDDHRTHSTDDSPSAAGHESLVTLDPIEMDPASIAYRTQVYRQQYGRLYRPGYGRHSSVSSTDRSSGGASSDLHPSQSLGGNFTARQRAPIPESRVSTAPTSTQPSVHSMQDAIPPLTYSKSSLPRSSSNFSDFDVHRSPSASHRTAANAALPTSASGNAMTLNASHHFMDLVNSNHTLSPFTRTLDTKGYAVRSHPVTPSSGSVASGATGSGSGHGQGSSLHGYKGYHGSTAASAAAKHQASRSVRSGSSAGGPNSSAVSVASAPLPSPALSDVRPASAGRRRTFKLGGSKSVPHSQPGTPTTETGSEGRYPLQEAQPRQHPGLSRWHTSAPSVASTEREQGSVYDSRLPAFGGGGATNAYVPHGKARTGPVRRASYDHSSRRRFPGPTSSVYSEQDFGSSNSIGARMMGSIRE